MRRGGEETVHTCSLSAQPEDTMVGGYFQGGILDLAEAQCSQEGDRMGKSPRGALGNLATP